MKCHKFDFWFIKQNINTKKHSDIAENFIISKDEEKIKYTKVMTEINRT